MVDITSMLKETNPDPSLGNDYAISEIAKKEWHSFAMYTVESRAIPNMIDGLKPVQRFYLYSSIKNSPRDYKKVSAISGVVSDYGYNHGESSAAGAGQLMAAEWSNNICLVQGRGSFGTRLVQSAAAARYTYTRLHDNFHKYVKDLDLSPEHDDPEHEPPTFYVPILPLVLVNGIKGIATGFATNILPRDPAGVINACREYIRTGNIKNKIKIKYPDFTGTVTYDAEQEKYFCNGSYTKQGKTVLTITEITYGHDRESYIKVLDKLEDAGDIVGYEDLCDKQGFKFDVKLKQNTSAKWSDTKIIQKFKLTAPLSENLTVITPEGNLRKYEDARDLIRDFVDYRNTILQKRIDLRVAEYTEEARWLHIKKQFIEAVLDGKIEFKGKNKAAITKQIFATTSAIEEDIDRLLRLNIYTLTSEEVKKLKDKIKECKQSLNFWKKTNTTEQFLTDLDME